jgi:hypothetical protein
VGSIPVHIGVRDLKVAGVTAVAHKYFKWTKGLALTTDDVELWAGNWEEYLPKGEGYQDVDAIADRYFKTVKGKKRFEAGARTLELILALPHEQYEISYQRSIEDHETLQAQQVLGNADDSDLLADHLHRPAT